MRVVTLYSLGWHNKYFDQVVLVLTTLDPLINHCVCLWTMSKYRDGYASSLGKVFSCFKPSEEGMFRSAITRLSTISRRSFSRSSTTARSSSMRTSRRKSSAITHTYKQVAQNNQDLPVEPGVEVREIQSDPKELVEQGHSSRNPWQGSLLIRCHSSVVIIFSLWLTNSSFTTRENDYLLDDCTGVNFPKLPKEGLDEQAVLMSQGYRSNLSADLHLCLNTQEDKNHSEKEEVTEPLLWPSSPLSVLYAEG